LNKKIIQILLFLLLIILTLFFYNKFFNLKDVKIDVKETSETNLKNKSNLIQNLKYEVNFKDNKKYKITAKESEITEENGIEIVYMVNVTAVFVDQKNTVLEIKSDKAVFNSSTYNTSFTSNIEINYLKNKLNSNKLILDFEKSIVTISDNIVYDGFKGIGKADNIKIDLINNSVEIFMDEKGKKIELIQKN